MKFKEKLSLVPNLPGSYQMLDENGVIIYVGKAKNLHKRVSSYFNREHTGKTAKLVENIHDFTYIVATTEVEAFLIEINLIKKYKPKYNIMLMDAKSYPYIEYISKPYPKLKISRYLNIKKKDNKILFGPYPNAYAARRIVNLINRLYPLKKCDNQKELCLYYHIGECLGYCSKNLDQNKVKEMENEILSFLRGNDKILKDKIMEKIKIYSDNLNFEMAQELKEELNYVNIVMEKQKIDLSDLKTRDVFGFFYKDGYMSVNVFFVRNGKLVGSKNDIYVCLDDEIDAAEYYIAEFYTRNEIPKEVYVSDNLNKNVLESVVETNFITPVKGVKKGLLDMALMNAKINYENKFKLLEKEDERTAGSNEELRKLLKLPKLTRIDLFDNSNLFGTFAVSAMVVFINGKPEKKEYRKYKIVVDKNDDYHTMQEVIYRRYNRAMIENTQMPDLILVDGGEIQIHAAKEVLSDLGLNIAVAGLKKDNKHNTNSLIDLNEEEIPLDITSNLFHYLTRMQDEVHRFAINYHRQIRSKGQISSVLDNVLGIGQKRRKDLIKKYKSITKIEEASIEELSKLIPKEIAINLKEYLKSIKEK
ncbi:MAG: excinuclease ABC subunit UvrC [Bacilli bacterium]|nr:excinuclease ABC subunit UvrC [Bacilli bacterium]